MNELELFGAICEFLYTFMVWGWMIWVVAGLHTINKRLDALEDKE